MGGPATVRIEPLGAELVVAPGETILQAAIRQGYRWPTICRGEGRCGQCWFVVREGAGHLPPPGVNEVRIVRWIEKRQGLGPIRLACRVRLTGAVTADRHGILRADASA